MGSTLQTKAVWTLVKDFTCTNIIVVVFNERESKYELQWIKNDKSDCLRFFKSQMAHSLHLCTLSRKSTLGSKLQTKAVWASRGSQLWGV